MSSIAPGKFTLGEIVLSKKEPFTLEEIKQELKGQGVDFNNDEELNVILKSYRDNGIIVQRGHKYTLSQFWAR